VSDEDTKVASIFDKDIENFGKDLDKMIEHLNIVIATHNKQVEEIERLNNIINKTIKYVESLSSCGRGCDIYDDIKQEILKELKGSEKE